MRQPVFIYTELNKRSWLGGQSTNSSNKLKSNQVKKTAADNGGHLLRPMWMDSGIGRIAG